MKAVRTFLVLGALLLWSCTHNTAPSEKEIARLAPQELGNGALQITTEREDYSWRASDLGSNQIIVATVENLSDNTLYARLGDGFSGIEQERLSVASGSHGYLEQWQQGKGWREMPRSELIEGVRYVVLEPKKTIAL